MEAQTTKLLIQEAIEVELENAREQWGPQYNTPHEAYAVLKEEVEEAMDDLTIIQQDLDFLWSAVKGNSDKPYKAALKHIQQTALALAIEAVQIAAVVKKAELKHGDI
jgi:nitrate/nitrite-specific signal transduction histidine kinase